MPAPTMTPAFGHYVPLNVNDYATQVAGNKHLGLYKVPPSGNREFDWYFVHRGNSKAAVHAFTVIENDQGEKFVHLLVMKRPPLGGRLTVELPAGLWGDTDENEDVLTAAEREVKEETGYDIAGSMMLSPNFFATSPGLTTEQKAFALVKAKGQPGQDHQEAAEKDIIVGTMDVPLATFTQHREFTRWLNRMDHEGYMVSMSVMAARGLLPPNLGQKLDRMA